MLVLECVRGSRLLQRACACVCIAGLFACSTSGTNRPAPVEFQDERGCTRYFVTRYGASPGSSTTALYDRNRKLPTGKKTGIFTAQGNKRWVCQKSQKLIFGKCLKKNLKN